MKIVASPAVNLGGTKKKKMKNKTTTWPCRRRRRRPYILRSFCLLPSSPLPDGFVPTLGDPKDAFFLVLLKLGSSTLYLCNSGVNDVDT